MQISLKTQSLLQVNECYPHGLLQKCLGFDFRFCAYEKMSAHIIHMELNLLHEARNMNIAPKQKICFPFYCLDNNLFRDLHVWN